MGPGRESAILTRRQVQVLKLIAAGLSTKQIAAILNVTFKTVECHRSHVMDKLNIHEIAGLTRYAIRRGYIEMPGDPTSGAAQERLFEQVSRTYADYKKAMDDYTRFIHERQHLGLENLDSSTGARRLREAEKAAHEKYHSALLALKKSPLLRHSP